jgi:hypothetical protein
MPDIPQLDAADAELRSIPVDKIERNPENPRIIFRQDELERLLDSIRLYGIQVPIAVYREHNKYILIDGERRWKCAQKLNKREIPALIQKKPSALNNLLLMFNIHAMREQWDLLTVALKLPLVIKLWKGVTNSDREPNEIQLAEVTALPRAWIRRSKLLLALPDEYKDMLLGELRKPKWQQKLSEDFFIEMERSLNVVAKRMPDLVKSRDRVRRVLLEKYTSGVISNLVKLRDISKIARAAAVDADESRAHAALSKLFQKNDYPIERAFDESTVREAYLERDVLTRIQALIARLQQIDPDEVDDDVRAQLRLLINTAEELLENAG